MSSFEFHLWCVVVTVYVKNKFHIVVVLISRELEEKVPRYNDAS